jgi:O-antigen ligase
MHAARAARAAVVAPAAVVPLIFTTRYNDVFYPPKVIALWVVLLVAVWAVVLTSPRPPRWVRSVDVAVAAFTAWHGLALAVSTDRHQSLFGERLQHQGVLTLVLYVCFFYLARVCVTSTQALWRLLHAVVAGAVVVAGYALAQRVGIDPVWHGELPAGRVFSTIGQPNALAAYFVLALPAAVVLAWRARRVVARAGFGAAAVAMLAALAFTQSRGGYLALGVVLPILALGLWRERAARATAKTGLAVAAALLIAVAVLWPAASAAWHRALTTSQATGDLSIRNHVETWRVAGRIVRDHPLVGTGPETFPDQFPRYSRLVLPADRVAFFDQFRVESPHNRYLAAAVDAGVPALLAYLAFLAAVGVVLVQAIRGSDDAEARLALLAVAAAVAGHVVTDGFMSAEITGSWLSWVLAGAGVAVTSKRSGQNASEMTRFGSHVRREAPRVDSTEEMMRVRTEATSSSVSVRSRA